MPRTLPAIAALAAALAASPAHADRLILVGDSTMASKSGYGDALCAQLKQDNTCVNLARGGRSSSSFRAEGLWDKVLELLKDKRQPTVVLIQFGHNDQPGKPGRSTDLVKDFPVNLTHYVSEVRAAGGRPVLLTPLTRRSFRGPWLHDDLAPWAATTRRVAQETGTPLLDLHKLSQSAVQTMGEAEADTLAMAPKPLPGQPVSPATTAERAGAANPVFDRTHLGEKGARLFSQMLASELRRLLPDWAPHFIKYGDKAPMRTSFALLGAALLIASSAQADTLPAGTLITGSVNGAAARLLGLKHEFADVVGSNITPLVADDMEFLTSDFAIGIDLFTDGTIQFWNNLDASTALPGNYTLTFSFAGASVSGIALGDVSAITGGTVATNWIDASTVSITFSNLSFSSEYASFSATVTSAVPEPASYGLLAAGLVLVAARRARRDAA